MLDIFSGVAAGYATGVGKRRYFGQRGTNPVSMQLDPVMEEPESCFDIIFRIRFRVYRTSEIQPRHRVHQIERKTRCKRELRYRWP